MVPPCGFNVCVVLKYLLSSHCVCQTVIFSGHIAPNKMDKSPGLHGPYILVFSGWRSGKKGSIKQISKIIRW